MSKKKQPWEPNEHEWAIIDQFRAVTQPGDITMICAKIIEDNMEGKISVQASKLFNRVAGKLLKDMEHALQRKNRDQCPDLRDLLPQRDNRVIDVDFVEVGRSGGPACGLPAPTRPNDEPSQADGLPIHQVCAIFPEIDAEDFIALRDDIQAKGLMDPIWTHDGQIIDGRHRYRACRDLGIEPAIREWAGEGGTIYEFVVSRNLVRRHLTTSQRAAIAAEIKPLIQAEIKAQSRAKASEAGRIGGKTAGRGRPSSPDRRSGKNAQPPITPRREARTEAATKLDVSPRSVTDAERIKAKSPETFEEVKAGKITLGEAKKRIDPPTTPKTTDEHADVAILIPDDDHAVAPKPHMAMGTKKKTMLSHDPKSAAQQIFCVFTGKDIEVFDEEYQRLRHRHLDIRNKAKRRR